MRVAAHAGRFALAMEFYKWVRVVQQQVWRNNKCKILLPFRQVLTFREPAIVCLQMANAT